MCRYLAAANGNSRSSLLDHQAMKNDALSRAEYLERENARLQRLVAELLVKNEQLRQMYLASLASSALVADPHEGRSSGGNRSAAEGRP
jgi:hypothetical protein